jgi:hypothetical protein
LSSLSARQLQQGCKSATAIGQCSNSKHAALWSSIIFLSLLSALQRRTSVQMSRGNQSAQQQQTRSSSNVVVLNHFLELAVCKVNVAGMQSGSKAISQCSESKHAVLWSSLTLLGSLSARQKQQACTAATAISHCSKDCSNSKHAALWSSITCLGSLSAVQRQKGVHSSYWLPQSSSARNFIVQSNCQAVAPHTAEAAYADPLLLLLPINTTQKTSTHSTMASAQSTMASTNTPPCSDSKQHIVFKQLHPPSKGS